MKRIVSVILAVVMLAGVMLAGNVGAALDPSLGVLPLDGKEIQFTGFDYTVDYVLDFQLEQSGQIDFTFSLDQTEANLYIKEVGYDSHIIRLLDVTKADYTANEVRSTTVYLDKGSYVFVLEEKSEDYDRRTNVKLSALFTPFASQEPFHGNTAAALLMPANKNLAELFTQWKDSDCYKLVVKKDYRVVLTITHELAMQFSGFFTESPSKSYSPLISFEDGSRENPATESVSVNLKKGTYFFSVNAKPAKDKQLEPWGGVYTLRMEVKPFLAAPKGLKPLVRKTDRQTVCFDAVKGAAGYQVQCSDGGTKWKYSITDSKTTATFQKLTPGGKYKFRVRSFVVENGKKIYSAWSATLSSCAKPATAKITNISTPKTGQMKTTWAKAGGVVSGYQIQFSKDKAFKSIIATKTFKTNSTRSYIGKNLTSGRTYYVRVRAYTVFNGNYFGAWSVVKGMKVK